MIHTVSPFWGIFPRMGILYVGGNTTVNRSCFTFSGIVYGAFLRRTMKRNFQSQKAAANKQAEQEGPYSWQKNEEVSV
jgi:hypothetical protein